jgi:nitrate reductase gamma subunit
MVVREVFWGVTSGLQLYFYLASTVAVLIFSYGLWSRISIWTEGSDKEEFSGWKSHNFIIFAFKSFFSKNCILAKKSFALASYRGIMLLFIMWGFSVLFIGTVLLTIHHYSVSFLIGSTYLIYSFALDVAGLVLLIGLCIAILRRHLVPDVRRITSTEDLFFLYLFLLIVVTGFSVEGLRLGATNPQNLDYSFVGGLFSTLLTFTGIDTALSYVTIWGAHVASVLLLIASLPYSKFFHIFASQISVAAAEKRYGGAISGRGY